MEPLTPKEMEALMAWMASKGLSQEAAAKELGVSDTSIIGWRKGGGIRPTARARLMAAIAPYLSAALPDPVQSPAPHADAPAGASPAFAAICNDLQRLEAASPAVLEVVRVQVRALAQQWPGVVARRNAPTISERIEAEVAPTTAAETGRPKTAPGLASRSAVPPVPPPIDAPQCWRLVYGGNSRLEFLRGVAAGPARSVLPSHLPARIVGYEQDKALGVLQLQGESMAPTFADGCQLVFRRFPSPVILGDDEDSHVPLSKIRAELRSGDAVILSLDRGETVTCKRLVMRGDDSSWGLWIFADNAEEPGFPRLVRRADHLTVYGRVLGLAVADGSR